MFQGRYLDGVQPLPQDVEVEGKPEGLVISIRRAETIKHVIWPYREIQREGGADPHLRHSRHGIDTGERLWLDATALEQIFGGVASQFARRGSFSERWHLIVGSVLALAVVAATVLFGLPAFARKVAPLVPYSWEVKLGENVEPQVLEMVADGRKVAFCTEPGTPARAALDAMTARLTGSLTLLGPLKVDVIDLPIANAFALPGGRIFLSRPVIEKAGTPDEVAGVLAHEIGHVIKRDSMRGLLHDGALSLLVGMILGDITGGSTIGMLGRMALGSAFSRDQEREADEISVRLMREAGADPRALNIFFRKVLAEDKDTGGLLSAFRSHPLTDERIKAVEKLAEGGERGRAPPLLSASEWEALRKACGQAK